MEEVRDRLLDCIDELVDDRDTSFNTQEAADWVDEAIAQIEDALESIRRALAYEEADAKRRLNVEDDQILLGLQGVA